MTCLILILDEDAEGDEVVDLVEGDAPRLGSRSRQMYQFDLSTFDLSKFDFSTFDFSKFDLSTFDLSTFDFSTELKVEGDAPRLESAGEGEGGAGRGGGRTGAPRTAGTRARTPVRSRRIEPGSLQLAVYRVEYIDR